MDIRPVLDNLIHQERLPASYHDTIAEVIEPLARQVADLAARRERPLVLGIHGAQGTGKSTLTRFLKALLEQRYQCPCASFSLDDLYHTRTTREQLAQRIHPLLITRGVPGTHDLDLGWRTLEQLWRASDHSETRLPAFSKALDDRLPEDQWPVFRGRPAVILLEGWCVGARPEPEAALARPCNELEAREDADGRWRHYVNRQLGTVYGDFFAAVQRLIMLQAPSMECVVRWRTLQEHKLAGHATDAPEEGMNAVANAPQKRTMTDAQIRRFVMHYERITRFALAEMPARADVLLSVDADHRIRCERMRLNREGGSR